MDVVRSICLDVFGEFDQLKIENRLGGKKLFLQVAYDQEIPVGFKLGYALENEVFYSWIGGVAPDYQDLGVATLFIKRQHEWCLQNGFKSIQTKSMNQFPRMISLNLNSGFKITGTEVGADEEVKILFEKSLES
ncbi:MAG: hypothetical protein A2622_03980 [Bdellovibrionales bacterium RIFCSPHIGHO2_01_FULL_40_29]|nr:MAG: hypothetical protein A2622_03980 [Bdellovibrionales bacterium RIFCSPHIGHO2_01_FULL_40_29]OFZ35425.1 MAG: hypothetical protein A3D17_08050 [Bdellovibrionales bacterium RIFCSPHIGHO2_02_FULL_40_15]